MPRNELRAYLPIAGLLAVVFLVFKLPSLGHTHNEGDEQIYLAVAKNLRDHGSYSLQGTAVLEHLPPGIYDKPFFHHPPLGVALMIPIMGTFGDSAAVVIAWLGHLVLLAAIFLWLRLLLGSAAVATVSVTLLCCVLDPLTHFVSQKIWLDSMLAGTTSLAPALFLAAIRTGRDGPSRGLLIASGIVMGLAILTKLPAVFVLPVFLALYLREHGLSELSALRPYLLYAGLPCVLLILPWFVVFHGHYGTLHPTWIGPDAHALEHNPFVKMMVERPVHYFFSQFALICPFLLLPLYRVVTARHTLGFHEKLGWGWMLGILLAFTLLTAIGGHSYQMRYVIMAIPPAYLLLGSALSAMELAARPAVLMAALGALLYNAMNSFVYLLHPKQAAMFSLFEAIGSMY